MSREKLENTLTKLSDGSPEVPALMTHVVLGYSSLEASMDLVRAMARSGAALIEMQLPFSDPMADGPTIMNASEKALASGCKIEDCFKAAEVLCSELDIPLLFMSYFNVINRYGVERFCKRAGEIGISGMIVPDISIECQREGYWKAAKDNQLAAIPLVSPVTSDGRMRSIAEAAGDSFVYCVSTTGTTGAKKAVPAELSSYLKRVRQHFKCPLAVGFGITEPSQIRALTGTAEIAIVGSAMLRKIDEVSNSELISTVEAFTRELASA